MSEIRKGLYKARKKQSKLIIYTGLKKIYSIWISDDKHDFASTVHMELPSKKDGIKVNVKPGSSGIWEAIGELDE